MDVALREKLREWWEKREKYKKRRKKKRNCFPSLCPILDRKLFKAALNSVSMYRTAFDVSALWHFLGSEHYALQYPLFSAVQRIVKNGPLGMTLSQLKYRFQWKSSPKIYLVILYWHKLGKWASSLGIHNCHACIEARTESERKTDRRAGPLYTHLCRLLLARVDQSLCQNTTVITYLGVYNSVTAPISLLRNPRSISTLAERLTPTCLPSTVLTEALPFLTCHKIIPTSSCKEAFILLEKILHAQEPEE